LLSVLTAHFCVTGWPLCHQDKILWVWSSSVTHVE